MKKMIPWLLLLTSVPAHADTTLPYVGPENSTCGVTQPTYLEDLDGGYETSEDCGIIYVKPPLIGTFITREPFVLQDVAMCPMIDKLYGSVAELMEQKQNLDPIANLAEFKKITDQTNALKKSIKKLAGNDAVGHVSAAATLGWSQLIEAYSIVNPMREVRALPITTGIFTSKIYTRTLSGPMADIGLPGVLNLTVNGIGVSDSLDNVNDMPLPILIQKLTAAEGSVNVFMGEAIGLSLTLDLAGACAALKDGNAKGLLSGTYTYFYPLQTKAQFKVVVEEELLEKIIFDVLRANGRSITADQVLAAIGDRKAVSVHVNPGFFPGSAEGQRLEKEYKDEITKLALDTVLSTVSQKTELAIEEATYHVREDRYTRSCKRKWYGRKSCHTTHYTVLVPHINWAVANKELKDMGFSGSASANVYSSLYMLGTSALLPGVK